MKDIILSTFTELGERETANPLILEIRARKIIFVK